MAKDPDELTTPAGHDPASTPEAGVVGPEAADAAIHGDDALAAATDRDLAPEATSTPNGDATVQDEPTVDGTGTVVAAGSGEATPVSADAAPADPVDEPPIDDPLAPVVAATPTRAAKVPEPADAPGEPPEAVPSSVVTHDKGHEDREGQGRAEQDVLVDRDVPGGGDRLDDDQDDDEGDELYDDDDPPKRRGGLLTKQVQIEAKHILLFAALLAVIALSVGAYVLGQRAGKDLVATGQPTTTVTTAFVQPKDWVPFEDKETGVKLSIPREWQQRSTKNLGPAARMFVQVPNTDDTVLLRVNSYAKEVTADNIADQKSVIDSILANEKLTILGVEQGDLRGMPVLVYIYSFQDPESGETGIHAHYFVFQGRKAVQLVFQALPQEHYTSGGLGLVWGKISDSLEIAPGPPPAFLEELGKAATPTTPAPGATTAPAPPTTG